MSNQHLSWCHTCQERMPEHTHNDPKSKRRGWSEITPPTPRDKTRNRRFLKGWS